MDLAEVRDLAETCRPLVSMPPGEAEGAAAEELRLKLKSVHDAAIDSLDFWQQRGSKMLLVGARPPPTDNDELLVDGVDSETIWQQLQAHSRSVERWSRAAELWLAERGALALAKPKAAASAPVVEDEEEEDEEESEEDSEEEDGEESVEEEDESEDDDDDEDDEEVEGEEKEERFFSEKDMEDFLAEGEEDEEEEDEEEDEEDEREKSEFGVESAKMSALARELESENVQDASSKRWDLRGEVTAADRPENSLLGLDGATWDSSRRTSRKVDVLDPDFTAGVESIIKERIVENRFDEVVSADLVARAEEERAKRNKPREEVDDGVLGTKSGVGLAEEYERDYVSRHEAPSSSEDAKPSRNEAVDALWSRLSSKLDALSHFHSTPVASNVFENALAKRNNVAAISLEEATPSAMATGDFLTPEEVHAKKRGKDATLRTSEEATTEERRAKRASKKRNRNAKRRRLAADAKIINRINPGLGNPYEKEKLRDKLTSAREAPPQAAGTFSSKNASSSLFHQLSQEARKAVHGDAGATSNKKLRRSSGDDAGRGGAAARALKL